MLFILTTYFSATKVFAMEPASKIDFSFKPHLCVLSETEGQCHDQFVAEWKTYRSEKMSLCLYQEAAEQPLQCWHDQSFGKLEFSSLLTKTTAFELRDVSTQQLLGREVFEVVYMQKKYQRSRRNPWSFF